MATSSDIPEKKMLFAFIFTLLILLMCFGTNQGAHLPRDEGKEKKTEVMKPSVVEFQMKSLLCTCSGGSPRNSRRNGEKELGLHPQPL